MHVRERKSILDSYVTHNDFYAAVNIASSSLEVEHIYNIRQVRLNIYILNTKTLQVNPKPTFTNEEMEKDFSLLNCYV
jgi:hypothetical protein